MTSGVPSNLDLEVLAAHLRRHTDDLTLYSGMLLNTLSAALPPHLVAVRREGKFKARLAGRGEPAVLAVSVTLGNQRYELSRAEFSAPATFAVCHQSGGVVMSTAQVSPEDWSQQLAASLVRHVGSNAAAVQALQRLAGP
jgi:hypothetical protein